MPKRNWKVEWRAQPTPDGLERLGQAVKLAIERSGARRKQARQIDEQPAVYANADIREELDA